MIDYIDNIDTIKTEHMHGFCVGWKAPLSAGRLHELLGGSSHFIVAFAEGRAVGFISALTDGVNSSFIPLLEVLPEWQGQGIGSELMRRMLDKLGGISNVDLTCDPDMQGFYGRFGMQPSRGMVLRKYLDCS